MEDINFCPACGKNVSPETPYCPACGARLNDPISEKRETEAEKKMGADRITIAAVLMLAYSIPLILVGIFFYVSAGNLSSEIFSDPSLAAMLAPYYTEASFTSFIELMGILSIIAGSIGVAAAVISLMRKFWALAIILCILSALIGGLTLFGLILGLIAFWMLYRAKPVFES